MHARVEKPSTPQTRNTFSKSYKNLARQFQALALFTSNSLVNNKNNKSLVFQKNLVLQQQPYSTQKTFKMNPFKPSYGGDQSPQRYNNGGDDKRDYRSRERDYRSSERRDYKSSSSSRHNPYDRNDRYRDQRGGRPGESYRSSSSSNNYGDKYLPTPPNGENSQPSFSQGPPPSTEPAYYREDLPEEELFKNQVNTGIEFEKYQDIPVTVNGKDVPKAINSFEEPNFDPVLKANIKHAKFDKPTPVQKNALPIVMAGRDLMACAQTGSGKTAAFLFPIIQQLLVEGISKPEKPEHKKIAFPSALILAPTRELVTQIYDEARKFTYKTGLKTCVVYGGVDAKRQTHMLYRGCDLIVATPGRLNDLMTRGHITLAGIKFLVLDEADRMLDMGFEPQIRKIVNGELMPAPGQRQTMMYSATFPKEIRQLAEDFLYNYIFLTVGRVGSTTDLITQKIEHVSNLDKAEHLVKLLHGKTERALVFVKTKRGADELEYKLMKNGTKAVAIHGDKTQSQREYALHEFKKGYKNVMIATDVAARGLDIDNVNLVINFDMPENIDSYIHRIGRTGRAGKPGTAISFYNEDAAVILKELIEIMEESKQEVPGWLLEAKKARWMERKSRGGYGGGRGGGFGRGGFGRGGFGGGRGGGFGGRPSYGSRPSYGGPSSYGAPPQQGSYNSAPVYGFQNSSQPAPSSANPFHRY